MKTYFYLFLSLLFFFSCSRGKNDPYTVNEVLKMAGDNRHELEKVIRYYRHSGEKEKLAAARFLIKHMPGKVSVIDSVSMDIFRLVKEEWHRFEKKRDLDAYLNPVIDSLLSHQRTGKTVIKDLDVIKADFLIENIELSFAVWEQPWSKHYTFDQFCEYILPYRVRTEPLSDWRRKLTEQYAWVIDSVAHDPEEIALYLNDLIGVEYKELDKSMNRVSYASVLEMMDTRAGICEHRYVIVVSLLRSMGIASAIDATPQINRWFKGHAWTVYFDSTGSIRPFDGGDPRHYPFQTNPPSGTFPPNAVMPMREGICSNVFRYKYSVNKNCLVNRLPAQHHRHIPPFFSDNTLENVTEAYEIPQISFSFPLDKNAVIDKNQPVYLSYVSYYQQLVPVDWAFLDRKRTVHFSSIGPGSVYFLSQYDEWSELQAISQPVLFPDSAASRYILLEPDLSQRATAVLTRKCNISPQMAEFAKGMIGGRFEGSDTPDFAHPDTFYTIDQAPDYLVEQAVHPERSYRYVRYYSPDRDIRVAEIQFCTKDIHGNDQLLAGAPIAYLSDDTTPPETVKNAFDDDIRTNLNASQGSWIGLDFQEAQVIHKIKYLPRNNFNVIEKGNVYELLYYDKAWVSLGQQTAVSQFIEYDDIPSHSLLLLKNLTQGKEERIFTYENERQAWW